MRAMHSLWGRAAGAAGIGALLFTYGCGTNPAGVRAQDVSAAQPGTSVIVGCEPNQRTLVRPVIVNGVAMSQVECVSTGEALVNAQAPLAQPAPVTYRTAPRFVQSARNDGLADARIVQPDTYPVATARPVRAQQVVYDEPRTVRTVKQGRSVKKSAVIIGSSAGVGAGVGAAVGGKKGALIGAVLGGGGAALWDQITRHKQ